MIIFVDIDKTICECEGGDGYSYDKAQPILANIEKINLLYEAGHVIIYWTARGTQTGLNWRHITERQLERWGVKYHELRMKKPYYDILIDDKAFKIEELDDVIHSGNGQ